MLHQKVCAYVPCSRPFSTRNPKGKHCSLPCRVRATQPYTPDEIRAYLLKNITVPENPDACWLWQGHVSKSHRYGIACFHKTHCQAHRASYEHFVGPIPEGLHVLHARHCSNRRCINPRHLYCGTNAENMADKAAVGAAPFGSSHCHTDLVEKDVEDILHLFHDKGWTMPAIAKRYKDRITRESIRSMIQRKTWRHVLPGQYPYIKPTEHNFTKLTEDEVRIMRKEYAEAIGAANGKKVKITPFAERYVRRYGVTNMAARMILKGQTWKHVTPLTVEHPVETVGNHRYTLKVTYLPDPEQRVVQAIGLLLNRPTPDVGSCPCGPGGPYCNCCGECLTCYGQDPCYASDDRQHVTP